MTAEPVDFLKAFIFYGLTVKVLEVFGMMMLTL